MGRGDHAKAPGWSLWLPPTKEGSRSGERLVPGTGDAKLIGADVCAWRICGARPGGQTDVSFHKTHPAVCGFLLTVAKWLWWDRPTAPLAPSLQLGLLSPAGRAPACPRLSKLELLGELGGSLQPRTTTGR